MGNDIVKANIDKLSSLKTTKSSTELLKDLKSIEKSDKMLLILLDTSSSMDESMGNTSKIETAWHVFHDELLPNMSNWTFGIIGFGDSGYWISYPTGSSTSLSLNSPYASGMTSMAHALRIAWDWAKGHAKEARFILLSDGRPNDMSPDDILGLVKENCRIPIDTVGIGKKGMFGSYDPEFLRAISALTGGIFTEVQDAKMLANTIKQLSPVERPLLGRVDKEVL